MSRGRYFVMSAGQAAKLGSSSNTLASQVADRKRKFNPKPVDLLKEAPLWRVRTEKDGKYDRLAVHAIKKFDRRDMDVVQYGSNGTTKKIKKGEEEVIAIASKTFEYIWDSTEPR